MCSLLPVSHPGSSHIDASSSSHSGSSQNHRGIHQPLLDASTRPQNSKSASIMFGSAPTGSLSVLPTESSVILTEPSVIPPLTSILEPLQGHKTHQMVTRSQTGKLKPKVWLAQTNESEPKTIRDALSSSH